MSRSFSGVLHIYPGRTTMTGVPSRMSGPIVWCRCRSNGTSSPARSIGSRRIRFIRVFNEFNNPALFNELIHPNEISGVILVGLDQVLITPDHNALMEAIVEPNSRSN